ncbi:MAG: prolyl 4-hydroxylase [Caulobacteraceae bacterium]|nr:MAG: prolyl 4-hydroxylase [Caulobacteraceae bacterium]
MVGDMDASRDDIMANARRALDGSSDASLLEAIAQLEHAAALGCGEAVARQAGLLAAGVHQRPDWDRSVDLLQRAAELGYAPALTELRLMAGDAEPGAAPAALRSRIDIRELVRPRPAQTAKSAPRIRIVPALFSAPECRWLISRAQSRLAPAAVYDNAMAGAVVIDERSNSEAAFGLAHLDVMLIFLRTRIAHSIGAPSHHLEQASVLHYAVGQQFAPHFDYLDPAMPGQAVDLARRGQRVATALVYLNDGYDGGETDFPRLGWRYRGAPGDALVFDNVDRTLTPDPRTYHAGLAPTRGEKWLLSQWVRDRPAA